METPKFTQEIKDKWVEALESGKFKQGYTELYYKDTSGVERFCCLGVLGAICDFLDNESTSVNGICPYHFLGETIGVDAKVTLWRLNDKYQNGRDSRPDNYQDDYSNVIEYIKNLKVQE